MPINTAFTTDWASGHAPKTRLVHARQRGHFVPRQTFVLARGLGGGGIDLQRGHN